MKSRVIEVLKSDKHISKVKRQPYWRLTVAIEDGNRHYPHAWTFNSHIGNAKQGQKLAVLITEDDQVLMDRQEAEES